MSSQKQTLDSALKDALGSGPASDRLLSQRARLIEWEEQRRRSLWGRLAGGSDGVLFTWPRAWFALALCGALTAFVVLMPGAATERAALVATSEGSALQENAWVTAASNTETLNFSEGSQIVVAEGGRARVAKLDRQGLRMTLESGKLEASITPKTGYRWVVQAGPRTVTVLGTIFSVEWSAEQQRLNVEVKRGRVQVDSATGSNPVARVLEAGESLSVVPPVAIADEAQQHSLPAVVPALVPALVPGLGPDTSAEASSQNAVGRSARAEAGEAHGALRGSAHGPVAAMSEPLPSAAPSLAEPSAKGSDEPKSVAAQAGSSWKDLADAGRYAEAVSAARALGVGALLGNTGVSELMLLADAARLGKAPDLAQQVLLAVRERFPSHANATIAAFQLGRLAFEVKHDDRAAVRWFQSYLDSSPGGSMAEGARGRLLRAWLRIGDQSQARAAAREYLQHHPHGHHASVAQSLLGD